MSIPLDIITEDNAIIAFVTTIFILCIFLVNEIVNSNDNTDNISTKYILRKLKQRNVYRIILAS